MKQNENLQLPNSREHALEILQAGFQNYQGRSSFNEEQYRMEQGRFSFNDNKKVMVHPKVMNIFDKPKKVKESQIVNVREGVFEPPTLFTTRQARKVGRQRFEIPQLPQGRTLRIKILSNWGDKVGVGINGIELFDAQGGNITRYVRMSVQEDQKNKQKLIDGYQAIQDDQHIWLSKNLKSEIIIDLTASIRLSLLRIWNYNKSRIHSYKGAKLIEIDLDDKLIFYGIIRKANGNLKKFQENCEYIVFTEDQKVIQRITDMDWLNRRVIDYSNKYLEQTITERPRTGQKSLQNSEKKEQQQQYSNRQELWILKYQQQEECVMIKDLSLEFLSKSKRPLGLNRIIIIDNENNVINTEKIIKTNLNDFDFQKLFSTQNLNTTDPYYMIWLKNRKIEIQFQCPLKLSCLKIYNYNENFTESYIIGSECVKIEFRNKTTKYCINNIYFILDLRPGPSIDNIDYSQVISLTNQMPIINKDNCLKPNQQLSEYYPFLIHPPFGMLVTIYLVSTHGDNHYIGLNGLELYDHEGTALLFKNKISYQIHAIPDLINDPRIVKNLTTPPYGKNCQAKQSFLAPFINTPLDKLRHNLSWIQDNKSHELDKQEINKIIIFFDQYIQFTALDFYNYTKNPERGVKESHIYINNRLIYQGYIQQSITDTNQNLSNRTTILFSDNQNIMQKIQPKLNYPQQEQVTQINEGEYLTTRKNNWNDAFQMRPTTCIQK